MHIYFLLLFRLYVLLPGGGCLVAGVYGDLHGGEDVCDGDEKRHDNILDEERLGVLDDCGLPVAEEGNGHVLGLF